MKKNKPAQQAPKKPNYPRYNFRCQPWLAERISQLALADKRTPSAFIRLVLEAHVAAKRA